MAASEVVITGVGIVSPLGLGKEEFWASLGAGRSGVRRISLFDPASLPVQIAGEVSDFNPKPYLYNRKVLKLMNRDIQLGVAAAKLACDDAGLGSGQMKSDRFGVVLGGDRICNPIPDSEAAYRNCMVEGRFDFGRWGSAGLAASFPLSFLRVLPNMIACHVSIAHDARGPNNTIHQGEVSSLSAVQEAARVIQRGMADVMLAGGASSQMDPYDWVRLCAMGGLSQRNDQPAAACRPFDALRDGEVRGEGAAVFVLERRQHAQARGATTFGALLGWACAAQGYHPQKPSGGDAIRRAMAAALQHARLPADQIGHVNARGCSTPEADRIEAQAIHEALPGVAVTAPRSFFGNLAAASGAMEMAATVLGHDHAQVPPTLNCDRPDPGCPIEIVRGASCAAAAPASMTLSWSESGHAAVVVVGRE